MKFHGHDDERISYWRKVIDSGRMLADEFMEAVGSGKIRNAVAPYPFTLHT